MSGRMNKTGIEWCDYTWNPIVGCSYEGCISDGKNYCYARKMGKRQKCPKCRDFIPHFHSERLDQPGKEKKPSLVFVCSMGDFYDPEVNATDWQPQVLQAIKDAPQHQFLILTKQPQNIIGSSEELYRERYESSFSNVWIGVSVTGPDDLWLIEDLVKRVPARRFVSFEPLLGRALPLDMFGAIDWAIIGPQSKPGKQPSRTLVSAIKNVCQWSGVPLFLKSNLDYPEKIQQYPGGLKGVNDEN